MLTAALVSTQLSHPALADRWHDDNGWWPIFPILWLLIVAGIVTTVVLVGRRNRALAGPRAGEAKLAERYAAGEIDAQEYRERLAVLKGPGR